MKKEYDFSDSVRNPDAKHIKKQVSLRLNKETIAYFKAMAIETGIPYQNLINLYLTECAHSGKKLTLKWASWGEGIGWLCLWLCPRPSYNTIFHPTPPNFLRLGSVLNQLFTGIYEVDASGSKSRAPCGHEGSSFAFDYARQVDPLLSFYHQDAINNRICLRQIGINYGRSRAVR